MANTVDIVIKTKIDLDTLQDMKDQFPNAAQEVISALCDTVLVELVKQALAAGLDRDQLAEEVVRRGVMKPFVDEALRRAGGPS